MKIFATKIIHPDGDIQETPLGILLKHWWKFALLIPILLPILTIGAIYFTITTILTIITGLPLEIRIKNHVKKYQKMNYENYYEDEQHLLNKRRQYKLFYTEFNHLLIAAAIIIIGIVVFFSFQS